MSLKKRVKRVTSEKIYARLTFDQTLDRDDYIEINPTLGVKYYDRTLI